MIITRRSLYSGKEHKQEIDVTPEQITAWRNGELIQNVMPHLTPDEREFLISGILPNEWESMHGTQRIDN